MSSEKSENRVKSFDELTKEVKASWSKEAWMVYEASSNAFKKEMDEINSDG